MSFRNIYTFICEYYFQNHAYWQIYFCYFPQPFCHKKFKGYMLIYRNAEGVHGQRKIGNTCPKPKPGQQRQTLNKSVCCFD